MPGMIFYLWFSHAVTAGVLTGLIVYLGRKRVSWDLTEVFDFIVAVTIPFTIWAGLMIANSSSKSLSNFGECLVISLAIPFAAAIRVSTCGFGDVTEQDWRSSIFSQLQGCGCGQTTKQVSAIESHLVHLLFMG